MRSSIKQKLTNEIPEIGGRVLDSHQAAAGTVKPFLVLRQGQEAEEKSLAGFKRIIEVLPYDGQTSSFQSLDLLADKVLAALDRQRITTTGGDVFSCRYAGSANGDYVDAQLEAITRGLQFVINAVQPLTQAETYQGDPWLEALALWTGGLLGEGWHIYRNILPTGYNYPSVLWRIAGVEVKEKSGSLFEVKKKITGHVLGSTFNQQLGGLMALAQELSKAVKIVVDQAGKRYFTVSSPVVDPTVDPFAGGQLTVVLSGLTEKTTETAPLITAVHDAGIIG